MKNLAYLMEFDTTYGRLKHDVQVRKNTLVIIGREIKFYQESEAGNLPWEDLGADIVIEATGMNTTAEKSHGHIKAGAKKVIITAPADEETKIIVFGVNEDIIT